MIRELILSGAVALTSFGAMAGDDVSDKRFQDWHVVCYPEAGKTECRLSTAQRDNRTSIAIRIVFDGFAPGDNIQVVAPWDMLLEPGIGFSVGDDSLRVLPYETCMPQGCLALITPDQRMLDAIHSAAVLHVIVVPKSSNDPVGPGVPADAPHEPVDVVISLAGFNEALAYFEKVRPH